MSLRAAFHLSYILRKCVSHSAICLVKQTHTQIFVSDYLSDVTLLTDLLLAYTRCGLLQYARLVFDRMPQRNMHSWNILISSYVQNSLHCEAISIFVRFVKMGIRPDHYTLPSLFKACTGVGDGLFGKMLHSWVVRLGFEGYVVVGSSVLDFYLKRGQLVDAKRVFCSMLWRDSGAWNLMISGLGRAGFYAEALTLFRDMLSERVKMDSLIIPSVLNACGGEGDLMGGKEIHGQVVKSTFFNEDVAIGNSLIDMYAKCGHLFQSQMVFSSMNNLNLVTWTALISCYGIHGKGEESLALFKNMKNCGFKPNPITLTAVLSSCSHSGLIDEGRSIFNSIWLEYGFEPCIEHYACMVDLLGRFGHLEEALRLIHNMRVPATASVWGALLSGCMTHKNVKIGEVAAFNLFELEPRNSSNYIALCAIYEYHSIWDGIKIIRAKMRELGLVKTPGCSWITIKGMMHKFYKGDYSHPLTKGICETLDGIVKASTLPDYF